MADDIPAHRRAFTPRSGDTHVIGKDGKAVNVDQAERAKAVPPKAEAAPAAEDAAAESKLPPRPSR